MATGRLVLGISFLKRIHLHVKSYWPLLAFSIDPPSTQPHLNLEVPLICGVLWPLFLMVLCGW